MNSPATSSEYSLREDDDWDLVVSSVPSSSVASPFPVDAAHLHSDAETDQDITDVGSESSSQPSDIEDPDLLGEHILAADDSGEDERVNEALANSLASTLDPLRLPLSPMSPFASGSMLDTPLHLGNALRLSFPDPLTASAESHLETAGSVDAVDVPAYIPDHYPPFESFASPGHSVVDEKASLKCENPTEGAENPDTGAPISIEHEPAEDSSPQQITPKVQARSLDEADKVWKATYANLISHPWATSVILTVLALVLTSFVVQAHQFWSSGSSPAVVTPTIPSIPTPLSINSVESSPVHMKPVAPFAPIETTETPGAGPSKPVAKSPKVVDVTKHLTVRGVTRSGCATALPRKKQCATYKGKEKEVLPEEDILLLDSPAPTTLPVMQSLQDIHDTITALIEPSAGRHRSKAELAAQNFHKAIDLLLSRLLEQTSRLLREVSSLVGSVQRTAEDIVVSADHFLCSAQKKAYELLDTSQQFAKDIISMPSIVQAKESLKHRRSKARNRANFLVKGLSNTIHRARHQTRNGPMGERIQKAKAGVRRSAENLKAAVDNKARAVGSTSRLSFKEMANAKRAARRRVRKAKGNDATSQERLHDALLNAQPV